MSYKLRLRELRQARGLTQTAVAAAVNTTPGAVNQWESGLTQPSMANLVALTAALDCTLDELVDIQATG